MLVKCQLKDTSLKNVKAPGVIAAATKTLSDAINKSNGKLTAKDKSPDGFVLTALITTLKGDNPLTPTKLETKIAVTSLTVGSTAKAFTGAANGAIPSGVGKNVQGSAQDLVSDVLDAFMPKAIHTMIGFIGKP